MLPMRYLFSLRNYQDPHRRLHPTETCYPGLSLLSPLTRYTPAKENMMFGAKETRNGHASYIRPTFSAIAVRM